MGHVRHAISAISNSLLIALSCCRTREGFMRHVFATNAFVMCGGFPLIGY